MSYVYKRSEPGLYTVGFYEPDGLWQPESDHDDAAAAAARVRYLNGGRDPEQQPQQSAPGSWRVEGPTEKNGFEVWEQKGRGSMLIAKCGHAGFDHANALKMAAAPDLLRAIERIVYNPEARIGGDIRAEAIAAMRRAKGET